MKNIYNGITNPNNPDRKIYYCWNDMKYRCNKNKSHLFVNYGGRGITVCDEWLDFLVFYKWAKENGWKEGLQLDRINNDGNYEPGNCQFITNAENNAIGKKRKRVNNKTGYIGTCKLPNGKYSAKITVNKKQIFLGDYITLKEAVEARIKAEILYFNEQRTNFHYVK